MAIFYDEYLNEHGGAHNKYSNLQSDKADREIKKGNVNKAFKHDVEASKYATFGTDDPDERDEFRKNKADFQKKFGGPEKKAVKEACEYILSMLDEADQSDDKPSKKKVDEDKRRKIYDDLHDILNSYDSPGPSVGHGCRVRSKKTGKWIDSYC